MAITAQQPGTQVAYGSVEETVFSTIWLIKFGYAVLGNVKYRTLLHFWNMGEENKMGIMYGGKYLIEQYG